jgi:hypothetical protein
MPAKWLRGRGVFSMNKMDSGMIHVSDKIQQDGERIQHASQQGIQFRTDKLFLEFSI